MSQITQPTNFSIFVSSSSGSGSTLGLSSLETNGMGGMGELVLLRDMHGCVAISYSRGKEDMKMVSSEES